MFARPRLDSFHPVSAESRDALTGKRAQVALVHELSGYDCSTHSGFGKAEAGQNAVPQADWWAVGRRPQKLGLSRLNRDVWSLYLLEETDVST